PLIREYAGTYSYGDGLGMNYTLTLRADAHFDSVLRGCLGVYERTDGMARVEGKFLVIAEAARPGKEGARPVPYLPIRWGGRHYLIARHELPAFSEAINAGEEPRGGARGLFYLRSGEWNAEAAGLP